MYFNRDVLNFVEPIARGVAREESQLLNVYKPLVCDDERVEVVIGPDDKKDYPTDEKP